MSEIVTESDEILLTIHCGIGGRWHGPAGGTVVQLAERMPVHRVEVSSRGKMDSAAAESARPSVTIIICGL